MQVASVPLIGKIRSCGENREHRRLTNIKRWVRCLDSGDDGRLADLDDGRIAVDVATPCREPNPIARGLRGRYPKAGARGPGDLVRGIAVVSGIPSVGDRVGRARGDLQLRTRSHLNRGAARLCRYVEIGTGADMNRRREALYREDAYAVRRGGPRDLDVVGRRDGRMNGDLRTCTHYIVRRVEPFIGEGL